jgi:hypothetical protein
MQNYSSIFRNQKSKSKKGEGNTLNLMDIRKEILYPKI